MKGKKVFSLVLSIFLLAGLVGAAAVFSKNFTEIPQFLLATTEENIKHTETIESGSEKEALEAEDLNKIEDYQGKCIYKSSDEEDPFRTSQTLYSNTAENGIYYCYIEKDFVVERNIKYYGVEFKFILNDGTIKYWALGLDEDYNNPILTLPEENIGIDYLISFSYFGNNPDLTKYFDRYSDYEIVQTNDSEIGFKLFLLMSPSAELTHETITLNYSNVEESFEETSYFERKNWYYSDSNKLNLYELNNPLDSVDLNIQIDRCYSDDTIEEYQINGLHFDDIENYGQLRVTYSTREIDFSPGDHWMQDNFRLLATINISNHTSGSLSGYFYIFYKLRSMIIEGEVPQYTGQYNITLRERDINTLTNILLIDNANTDSNSVTLYKLKYVMIRGMRPYMYGGGGGPTTTYNWRDDQQLEPCNQGNSLEVNLNQEDDEILISGKNKSQDGTLGIEALSIPYSALELNFFIDIQIEIEQVGSSSNFTETFVNNNIHYHEGL